VPDELPCVREKLVGVQMKKLTLLVIFLSFMFGLAFAQTLDGKVRVLFCNFDDAPIYLALGDMDDILLETKEIGAYSTSLMAETSNTGSYELYYANNAEDDWLYWEDEYGEPFTIELEADKVIVIIIRKDGSVYYTSLDYDAGKSAKISLLNQSGKTQNRFEIANEFNDGNVLYSEDLQNDYQTDFANVDNGYYGIYWEDAEVAARGNHYYYPDDEGDVLKYKFNSPNWYLVALYDKSGATYANIYKVTP
jgi:hypothetical protein